jgi:hypothetical protein
MLTTRHNGWALKTEDPAVVKEIDSVFVTVEPEGGAKKPSGQRLLYAYLGEANPTSNAMFSSVKFCTVVSSVLTSRRSYFHGINLFLAQSFPSGGIHTLEADV